MSKYELPIGKNKKVIWLIKNEELEGKIMKELVALGAKTYSYLTDKYKNVKKDKGKKKCVIKRILNFNDYKYCLYNKHLNVKHVVYILKNSIRLY